MNRLHALAAASLALSSAALAQHVVPTAFQNAPAGSSFLGPLANAQRTYQLLIHADQLAPLVGQDLTGIAWRIPPTAANPWPAAAVNFANYDIYLSGSVDPANRSLTFADNIVGTQTQVRSGALEILAGSHASGGSPVNSFGSTISFGQSWTYTGGNLLVEIRHTGFTGTSQAVEAVAASNPSAGYGTQFSAAWTGNYAGTSGSQGNFGMIEFTAIPAPSAAAVMGLGLFAALRRRRR